MNDVVIGLGGNVGDVAEKFRRARAALGQLGTLRSAPLYRTAPIGPEQPPYLNSAVRVRWDVVTPGELIATVLEIERMLGRDRRGEPRWGPRTIDLDIVAFERATVSDPDLVVPHPELPNRDFWQRELALLRRGTDRVR